MTRRDTEELPTIVPMGDEALEALLRAAEGIERPLDDRMLLGRVTLTTETFRNMTRKAKVNKRFKRNRDKPVGRPKSHYKTKQKLKKANNRRNYLKNTKPKIAEKKRQETMKNRPKAVSIHRSISPSPPLREEEGI